MSGPYTVVCLLLSVENVEIGVSVTLSVLCCLSVGRVLQHSPLPDLLPHSAASRQQTPLTELGFERG